ncbi:MAG: nickel pincer cofactor biosynthesis protein LarC [Nitrospirae bacterium]|nr:nickel pincer cofactor biosynthesis protein LarC [Nitrospirota bacterium]
MTLAYFDCFSGISGDMTLGALVDAGLPIEVLRSELAKLDLPGYSLSSEKVRRSGIAATRVHVVLDEKKQPARHLSDIQKIINDSSLSLAVKQKSLSIFQRLAEVEAKVHGTTPEKVHFHEVGAVDALVDIVGSVIGLEHLGITEIIGSPLNVGSGTVHTAHGKLPVPAPATAELLRDIPLYSSSITFELTTPTGAALISTLASSFGLLPQMKVRSIAHGAGNKDIPGQPNVLRLMIGELLPVYDEDTSTLIETNIDDMNPQLYDHVIEKLLAQGAQDAYLTPIIMKKGRPGILLSVLCDRKNSDAVLDTLFRETTSIGVRIGETGRKKLQREVRQVETAYGTVRIKVSSRNGEVLTVTPEYEDCKKLADNKQVPLKTVMDEAKAKALSRKEIK